MTMIIRNNKVYAGSGGGSGNANIVKVTQAEYDALPESKNSDGVLYAITDGESSSAGEDADMVIYTEEDGSKTTVQDKLSELNSNFDEQNKKFDNTHSGEVTNIPTDGAYTIPYDGIINISGNTSATIWGHFSLLINNLTVCMLQNAGNSNVSGVYAIRVYKGDVVQCIVGDGGSIAYCNLIKKD